MRLSCGRTRQVCKDSGHHVKSLSQLPSFSTGLLRQNKSYNFWLCFPKSVPKGLIMTEIKTGCFKRKRVAGRNRKDSVFQEPCFPTE